MFLDKNNGKETAENLLKIYNLSKKEVQNVNSYSGLQIPLKKRERLGHYYIVMAQQTKNLSKNEHNKYLHGYHKKTSNITPSILRSRQFISTWLIGISKNKKYLCKLEKVIKMGDKNKILDFLYKQSTFDLLAKGFKAAMVSCQKA